MCIKCKSKTTITPFSWGITSWNPLSQGVTPRNALFARYNPLEPPFTPVITLFPYLSQTARITTTITGLILEGHQKYLQGNFNFYNERLKHKIILFWHKQIFLSLILKTLWLYSSTSWNKIQFLNYDMDLCCPLFKKKM